ARTTRAESLAGKRWRISPWTGPRGTSADASPPSRTKRLKGERAMLAERTRSIAGVSVLDSPLIADAIEYAQRLSEPYLFNHAMRSWLFAVKIGQAKAMECDDEALAVGAILHDIGLTDGVSGDNRFEVNGANAARAFINARGLFGRRAQVIWDLVAL